MLGITKSDKNHLQHWCWESLYVEYYDVCNNDNNAMIWFSMGMNLRARVIFKHPKVRLWSFPSQLQELQEELTASKKTQEENQEGSDSESVSRWVFLLVGSEFKTGLEKPFLLLTHDCTEFGGLDSHLIYITVSGRRTQSGFWHLRRAVIGFTNIISSHTCKSIARPGFRLTAFRMQDYTHAHMFKHV